MITDDSSVALLRTIPIPYVLGPRTFYSATGGTPLFTDNETNALRVFGPGSESLSKYVKDAFHEAVVRGVNATNPRLKGTKVALHYVFENVPPGESVVLRYRLSDRSDLDRPLVDVDELIVRRRVEADEFYEALHPPEATADERLVQRQAFAGLLWSKQSYLFDVDLWLDGDNPDQPTPASRKHGRNQHWRHLNSMRIMAVPDKWEYPWFAAWDLAFHCVSLALVDAEYAKHQLWVLLFEQFQHPSGQIPAYEWEFSDLNPPVHAWAVWRVYNMDRIRSGKADRKFLERCFHKLLMNFAWWVNKVDRAGTTFSKAAFSGSTTSRSSIAANEAATARAWNSPTPPAGWACFASI